MKIRGRLIIAFLIITAFPSFLMSVCFNFILSNQSALLEESYQSKTSASNILLNPIQILYTITQQDYEDLVALAEDRPDQLLDKEYLAQASEVLQQRDSFLIIRRNGKDYFVGNQTLYESLDTLPGFGGYTRGASTMLFLDPSIPGLIKSKDFYFSNHDQGQLFLITDLTRLLPQWKRSIQELLLCLLGILLVTACLLILWVYNSIVKPLNILRIATMQIGAGNLDYPVQVNSTDEIGELCQDFEEMRIRLREMINARIRYDEDTREMISNMAHDLQTPITSIKGYAEGILDGVANTPQKQEKYVRTILTKAVDMSYLIDELSVFAIVEKNSLPYHFIPLSLKEYFSDFLEDTRLDLETLNIHLEYFNTTAEDTVVLADPEQLKRVLNNITGNVVKYMDKQEGLVTLRITDGDGEPDSQNAAEYVCIELTDNGSGIAAQDLPHVFRRFYRGDISRNSSRRGSGLGLAIVERIIHDHGGRVWAQSTLGQGTSIFFTLKKQDKQDDAAERGMEYGKNTDH